MICEACGSDLVFDTEINDIEIFEINEDYCIVFVNCIGCEESWLVEYGFEDMQLDRI